ncbi:MAG: sigma-70 family RNA polymerase sigma factor [Rudanella sp.]|nr:sigma-70 family RNA polymerase sigma factor [Rudanella sp.]
MEKEFIELINRHPGILYKVCRAYGQQEADRQDLYQEIVLQLWRAFPMFRQQANASTWMYRVAMNTAISDYRKGKRTHPTIPFSQLITTLPDLSDEDTLPAEISQLYEAINQLGKIEKALILLYLDDKRYDEIASIMGITKSNVGVKLNRVKAKLEKLVNT